MASIAPLGKYQAFDDNGDPLVGGKLYTYLAGTNTPKATYTTAAGDVENTNPVILDSSGYADVWLGDGGYKFALTDADDSPIFTVDNIGGSSNTAFGGEVNAISSNTNITTVYANSANIATGSPTLSLLPAEDAGEGFYFSVKNEGVGTVTIDPDGSETIDGASTITIAPGNSALIITNGTAWYTLFYYQNYQPLDAELTALASTTSAADKVPYYTGSGTATTADFTAAGRTVVGGASAAAIYAGLVQAGAILQVVQVVKSDTFTSSSTSYTDITGLSASITPASASNKVFVFAQIQGDATTNNCFLQLVRTATAIDLGDAASNRTRASAQISALGSSGSFIATAVIPFLDSPATASSVTYKVQGMVPSSGSFFINRSQTDTDAATFARVASSITLIEVKG